MRNLCLKLRSIFLTSKISSHLADHPCLVRTDKTKSRYFAYCWLSKCIIQCCNHLSLSGESKQCVASKSKRSTLFIFIVLLPLPRCVQTSCRYDAPFLLDCIVNGLVDLTGETKLLFLALSMFSEEFA